MREKPKRAFWLGHGLEPRPPLHEKTPRERRENDICGVKGKTRNFGPHPSGTHPSNVHLSGHHIAKERWGLLLVDADWHAFSQALYKGIEGEDWGGLYDAFTEMSRAVGDQKPQEAQKGKALWKMKAAKDAGEEYYDPEREDNILVRTQDTISTFGRAPQRSDCGTG